MVNIPLKFPPRMLHNFQSFHTCNKNDKPKATVIEFVGPPGAGKSTNSQVLSELLKSKGVRVCELQDIKRYVRELGFPERLLVLLKLVFVKSPGIVYYMLTLAAYRIYSINSVYRFLRLIIFDLALQQLRKNLCIDVVVLEQWIIQELWSATIFKLDSYTNIGKHLSRFYFKSDLVFYLDIDSNTASERIGSRKSNLSRFDLMPPKQRIEELQKYNTYLFQLFENSTCSHKLFSKGYDRPEINAAVFLHHLDKKLNPN